MCLVCLLVCWATEGVCVRGCGCVCWVCEGVWVCVLGVGLETWCITCKEPITPINLLTQHDIGHGRHLAALTSFPPPTLSPSSFLPFPVSYFPLIPQAHFLTFSPSHSAHIHTYFIALLQALPPPILSTHPNITSIHPPSAPFPHH